MKVAVLSGKGGTGKTTVSVNLAAVAENSVYVDCDVEEPNGHLFFKPDNVIREPVTVPVPRSDPDKCNGCMKCVRFCRFNALAYSLDRLTVFDDMCHSCGGCAVICPLNAITEYPRTVGYTESGRSGDVDVHTGIMNVGEAAGIPIIGRLMECIASAGERDIFIDCPPGSSCSVMESIKDADFCVLVAEPTVFGTHNLNMVAEVVRVFDKPFGVILNKNIEGEPDPSEKYCFGNNIPIIGKIPFDRKLGMLGSEAAVASREDPEFRNMFCEFLKNIRRMAA